MKFIDHQHAKKISDWCNKYPGEAEAYFKEHSELSELFINHVISYDEFKQQSDQLKEKYHFLSDKEVREAKK
jgi:hypothetical protein